MKKMIIMLAVLMMTVPFNGIDAQDKGRKDWQDRCKAERIAYLTDAMELTSAEAEKFWPVYNRCESEKRNSFKAVMEAYKKLDEALRSGKDDEEIQILLDKYLAAQDNGKNIDRKYVAEYRKILPGKKVAKLYIADEEFRRQQIHRLRKNNNKNSK